MESKVAKNTSNCRKLTVSGLGNLAIKPLLQQQIGAAISLLTTSQFIPKTIPLNRLSHTNYVFYRSAIALKLASVWQLDPIDIAHQLTVALLTMSHTKFSAILVAGEGGGAKVGFLNGTWERDSDSWDFNVEVVSPGWIDFQLSDRSLARGLQQFLETPILPKSPTPYPLLKSEVLVKQTSIFPIQYTFARCCSLLRLGHQEDLIKLEMGSGAIFSGKIVAPLPIPWLDGDSNPSTEEEFWRLVHPAEFDLIFQILDLLDALPEADSLTWVKRGIAVSQSFARFYSSCRIWGEVKTYNLQLAQARLGLVGVTQTVLRSLLQDYLCLPAPVEL